MTYSKKVKEQLEKRKIKLGNEVSMKVDDSVYEGILLDTPEKDSDVLILKLKNGYNVGLNYNDSLNLISKDFSFSNKKELSVDENENQSLDYDVSILTFGGTISSKVEYKTGAVYPSISNEEFKQQFPEIKNFGEINFRNVFSLLSEDINISHWKEMGKEIFNELKKNKGVVATHGTDTMSYSSSAVSFMIQNPIKPVVFTGSQRSSDRGSSDNKENLLNSIFYSQRGVRGVYVCMHKNSEDGEGVLIRGVNARKMHSSKRNAFKSINSNPVASIDYKSKKIDYFSKINQREEGEMKLINNFNENVALIYVHPGIKPSFISKLSEYDGVVLMGTGLGHVPTNPLKDDLANPIFEEVKQLINSNIPVVMAPQTIHGRLNLNVYTSGRLLKEIGVIGHLCDWTPETAYVKLSWVLGQTKDMKKINDMMYTNYCGEYSERILYKEDYDEVE
jgi:glutamyl-tRNA(Gln) amidotransferase subunit D